MVSRPRNSDEILNYYCESVERLTNFEVFPEHEMFLQGAQVEIQFIL